MKAARSAGRRLELEALEPRVLLTTLLGGDIALFNQFDPTDIAADQPPVMRIELVGNVIAELIGFNLDGGNNVIVGNIPVTIVSSATGRFGTGLFGGIADQNVILIGETEVFDGGGGLVFGIPDPTGALDNPDINIHSIASRDEANDGQTFGFNINNDGTVVDLVELNTATGDATIVTNLLGALGVFGLDNPDDIEAAAFNPLDGLLYFVVKDANNNDQDTLLTLDVDAADIAASVTLVGVIDTDNNSIINAMAFELFNDGTEAALWAFRTDDGTGNGQIVRVDPSDATTVSTHQLTALVDLAPAVEQGITGMDFFRDDPTVLGDTLIAVSPDADLIYTIDLLGAGAGVVAVELGSTLDPTDTVDGVQLGNQIESLTFHPLLINPFTGDRGVLLATDTVSDQLMFVNTPNAIDDGNAQLAPVAPLGTFAIYISQADETASISITEVLAGADQAFGTADDVLVPFAGSTTVTIQAINTQNGQLIFVAQDGGSGGVFIGARTADLIDNTTDEQQFAVIQTSLGTTPYQIGVRPAMEDDIPGTDEIDVSAGIVGEESLLRFLDGLNLFDMLGNNLDRLTGLAVSLDGQTIAAIDTDGVDESGQSSVGGEFLGDQFTLLNRGPGGALSTNPRDVVLGGVGTRLSEVEGMDFGDPTLSDSETLFAVYNLGGESVLGTLDFSGNGDVEFVGVNGLGMDSRIRDLSGNGLAGVRTIAFRPGEGSIPGVQGLFVIDVDNQMWEVDPLSGLIVDASGNAIVDITAVTPDVVVDTDGNPFLITSMDFDGTGRLFGNSQAFGNLVDLNLEGRGTGQIIAGEFVRTSTGSLRPGVGAISFDFANDVFLATDNSVSEQAIAFEGFSPESAWLMELTGTQTSSPVGQNIANLMIAGTVTGRVDYAGSIDRMYVGWLITGGGDTIGTQVIASSPEAVLIPDNFRIGGDLRNLYTFDSIGTDTGQADLAAPTFMTGFDMEIGGRLGHVSTLDMFLGSAAVLNLDPVDGMSIEDLIPFENEDRFTQAEVTAGVPQPGEGLAWDDFRIVEANGSFFNDTFATAQRLGTIRSDFAGFDQVIVQGFLNSANAQNDNVDFYAVSLMAGQTVTVQLSSFSLLPHVGVINPDGTLIATEYSNVDELTTLHQPFQFTADRPGEYRFAVAWDGDVNFNGIADGAEGVSSAGFDVLYTLEVINEGDIALAGIIAQNILNTGIGTSFSVARGDLGSITAALAYAFSGLPQPVTVAAGNLRSIDAGQVGLGTSLPNLTPPQTTIWDTHVTLNVSNNIGLLRSVLDVLRFDSVVIGGDLQVADAFTDFHINLQAGGGIGVIRAGEMTTAEDGTSINTPAIRASTIQLNTDGIGRDGIIDLIDIGPVTPNLGGDFGGLGMGGPQIDTGPGGNVRFIRVDGNVFQDTFFGGGAPTRTIFEAGASATLTDDSGGVIHVSPGLSFNEDFDPTQVGVAGADPAVTTLFEDAQIFVVTYGIRNSGGVVVVKIESDGSLDITSNSLGNAGSVEVGEIFIRADGAGIDAPLVDDGNGNFARNANPSLDELVLLLDEVPDIDDIVDGDPNVIVGIQDLNLSITGSAPVDVYNILAATTIPTDGNGIINGTVLFQSINGPIRGGVFSQLKNSTGGDIVNMAIGGAGDLNVRGSLGVTEGHTGAAVLGSDQSFFAAVLYQLFPYPFRNQRTGVVSGTILSANIGEAVGNLVINNPGLTDDREYDADFEHLVRLTANSDHVNNPNVFEGIVGPILVSGDIGVVDIGEGIAPSGTGNVSFAGIYGYQDIDHVRGVGPGVDIRGDIVANNIINQVSLDGGSIINADIMSVGRNAPHNDSVVLLDEHLEDAREFVEGTISVEVADSFPDPVEEIGLVVIRGEGGVIGSLFNAADIGDIRVEGGFGLLNSVIFVPGDGAIGDLRIDGYGIRTLGVFGGTQVGDILATGTGVELSVLGFSTSVRTSEIGSFAPDGLMVNSLNDLNAFLGTSVLTPTIVGLTTAGVIDGLDARASRDLSSVDGFMIRSSSLAFANSIGRVLTHGADPRNDFSINGLLIRTGRIDRFQPDGGDISALDMEIAGELKRLDIRGDVLGNSRIAASGPNGVIRRLSIAGNLIGDVIATGHVERLEIGGDMTGNLIIDGFTATDRIPALGRFDLGGSLVAGNFNVNGNVGQFNVAGGLGSSGDQLRINGNLERLEVGRRAAVPGSDMALDLVVLGNLRQMNVLGMVSGQVTVEGNAERVSVRADEATMTGVLWADLFEVGGTLGRFEIRDGDVGDEAKVVVADGIDRVSVVNGDVLLGAEIVSSFGNINRIEVRDGNLMGAFRTPNGNIGRLEVTGGDLMATVSALALDRLRVDGSILAGTTIGVTGHVNEIRTLFSIENGVALNLGSVKQVRVGEDFDGSLVSGYYNGATQIQVGDDMDGDMEVHSTSSELRITDEFRGTFFAYGDVTRFEARTSIEGGAIIVDGTLRELRTGVIDGSVIVTGLGLQRLDAQGAIFDSVIQVGQSRGEDGVFGTPDAFETARLADLGEVRAGAISGTLIAAGGGVTRVTATNVTNSSISAGLSIGGTAIQTVIDDVVAVDDPFDTLGIAALLSQDDRTLLRGDIGQFQAVSLVNTDVTAGVDPGDDGLFGTMDDSVTTSLTGGTSVIQDIRVTGNADAASSLVTDGGIVRQTLLGVPNIVRVDYNVLTDLDAAINAGSQVGTASQVAPLVVNIGGVTFTITVRGVGFVDAFDTGGNTTLDALVIRGTDSRTEVTITTNGDAGIGRLLAADDAGLAVLRFVDPTGITDLTLTGDGVEGTRDLQLESPMNLLAVGTTADGFTGQIGGTVRDLQVQSLGGRLFVGGAVERATLLSSNGDPFLRDLTDQPIGGGTVTTFSVDPAGGVFAFDPTLGAAGQLYRAGLLTDPATFAAGPFDVVDRIAGAVTITSMDFDNAAGLLFGVADLFDFNPVQEIGAIGAGSVALRGLAVTGAGRVFATDSSNNVDGDGDLDDQLVEIDPATGALTLIGTLRDLDNNTFTNHVLAMAADNAGNVLALVSDRDGDGNAFSPADGAAIVRISTTPTFDIDGNRIARVTSPTSAFQRGVFLNGGGVTNDFTALAVNAGGTIFAVRRNLADTQDELVTVSTAGVVTVVGGGTVQVDGADTSLIGIGFTANGSLIGVTSDGISAQQIEINLADPSSSAALTDAGTVNADLDAFAMGRSGSEFTAFGFDTDASNGLFFSSPGVATATLGLVDPATGQFTRLASIVDTAGELVGSPVVDIALVRNPVTAADNVFVVTADGSVRQVDAGTGFTIADLGTVVDSAGRTLEISSIESLPGADNTFGTGDDVLIAVDGRFERVVNIGLTFDGGGAASLDVERTFALLESGSAVAIGGDALLNLAFDPVTGEVRAFDTDAGRYSVLRGTTPDSTGGLIATSFGTVDVSDGFAGRLAATGNTIQRVTVVGDFLGILSTASRLTEYRQSDGDFAGRIFAARGVDRFTTTRGNVTDEGLIVVSAGLATDVRIDGVFDGTLIAPRIERMTVAGDGGDDAVIDASGGARQVSFGGDFDGQANLHSVESLRITDELGSTANLVVTHDATDLRFGQTAAGSVAHIGGHVRSLQIGGTHRGSLAIDLGLESGRIGSATESLLVVGGHTGQVQFGDSMDSIFSFATQIGADGLYNTTDDVITGGTVRSLRFSGLLRDTAIAVGVLPELGATTVAGTPGLIRFLDDYLGSGEQDSAEAGGSLRTSLGEFRVDGRVVHSNPGGGRATVLAVADQLVSLRGTDALNVFRRVYDDPFGPPAIVGGVTAFNANELRVTFSELINTASLILSEDLNGDGDIDDLTDTVGTVTIRNAQTGRVLDSSDSVSIRYFTQTLGDSEQGVLRVLKSDGFGGIDVSVELAGNAPEGPAIIDRSGLRSSLRDFDADGVRELNEDPFRTILDVDNNLLEGNGIFNLGGFVGSVTQSVGFEGVNFDDVVAENNGSGLTPPDTILAVGIDHVIELVNSNIAIFDKAGTPLFASSLDAFFAPLGGGDLFDPVIIYDEYTDRFVIVVLDRGAGDGSSDVLYAISDTGDPLDGFTEMHRLDFGPNLFPDYPRIGFNADFHAVSFNTFTTADIYIQTDVLVVDSDSVLDADSDTFDFTILTLDTSFFTFTPAVMHEAAPGDPLVFVSEAGFANGNTIRVSTLSDPLNAPLFNHAAVTVTPYGFPTSAEQPGFGVMDTNDTRVLSAAMRGDRLIAAHTVGEDGVARARIYEFDVSSLIDPQVTQEITIDRGEGVFTYFPAADINAAGDIGFTWMQSSASEFVSMYVSGQAAGSADGSFALPLLVRAGEATHASFSGIPFRAGDYAGLVVDPVDDSFWAANEYASSPTPPIFSADANWATFISNFTVSPLAPFSLSASSHDLVGVMAGDLSALSQLVYLDLDGGSLNGLTAGELTGSINIDRYVAMTDAVVTAALSDLVAIFGDVIDTRWVGSDALAAAGGDPDLLTRGLVFTTVDPSRFGLDPLRDFTTILVGPSTSTVGDVAGLAYKVDVLNRDRGGSAVVFSDQVAAILGEQDQGDSRPLAERFGRALANVIAHELGHTLGLADDDPESVARYLASVRSSLPAGDLTLIGISLDGEVDDVLYRLRVVSGDLEVLNSNRGSLEELLMALV